MKIGKLAESTGCTVQTIRYYEKEGLLSPPARSEANYRVYNKASLEQLTFIKHCRNLDIALAEIKQLMELKRSPDDQCLEINDLIDNHINRIDTRLEELNNLRGSLVQLRAKCNDARTIKECGILQNLQGEV